MKKLLGVTLGIMTALGGFVDLGQIVFTTQAGALSDTNLCGRSCWAPQPSSSTWKCAAGSPWLRKNRCSPVVRTRLGFPVGLATLIASNLLNLITCAAELGGVAIVLRLLTGWPEKLLLIGIILAFGAMVLLFRFQWIERTLGLSRLMMIVFAVSAVVLHPDWNQMLKGLLPTFSSTRYQARSSLCLFRGRHLQRNADGVRSPFLLFRRN